MATKNLTTTFSLCSHQSLVNRDSNFFTISASGIKILKEGYYEINASIMVRTGFSANDLVVVQIGPSANDPVVKSQIRVQDANAWENIVIPPRIMYISANTTLGMYARNETVARGTISGNNPIDDRITIALKQLV